jgi:2-polyprenyl-3-methyl-5-hydroxy-6-metoxy-1,4-benzoquinol methylase
VNSTLRHIRTRRAALQREIETATHFEEWEESCVPSYCHPNPLAALVSWWRLYRAVGMAKRHCPEGRRALDFGASVGELARLLPEAVGYDFVEAHDKAASYLMSQLPQAQRRDLASIMPRAYDWIFAIDSLEHNDNYASLLAALAQGLAPGGVLVLSGPTENWLYKLGRRIAGFGGHYHKTTIYHIEDAARAAGLERCGLSVILPGLPLFRLSAWSLRSGSRKA